MKEESRARFVLVVDAILLNLSFVLVVTALVAPSLLSKFIRGYVTADPNRIENVLQGISPEKQDEIRELTITFTEKVVIYSYVILTITYAILYLVLYSGVTKRSSGQLHCWFLAHCVLLGFGIVTTVWILGSTPNLIVYHIPDMIGMAYRIVSLMIIREYRSFLHARNELSNYNVRYSLT